LFARMEAIVSDFIDNLHIGWILLIIAVCLGLLGKGADLLVEEAVSLSVRLGVSKAVIGATIVSLGTTLPEASVSVASAIKGYPGLALGNAVGSIICDTGLIMGLAILLGRVPVSRSLVRHQGLVQLVAGFALALICVPFSNLGGIFTEGGRLPQWGGFLFLALLVVYLVISFRWAEQGEVVIEGVKAHEISAVRTIINIVIGLAMIIGSSEALIPSVEEVAVRADIPEEIIAGTLVAFGTSLPELVTAITAVRKNHGELAIGNVIGADILNVLFVAGASAAVTSDGLTAGPQFFTKLFPAMLIILVVFRLTTQFCKGVMPKTTGFILLGTYAAYLAFSW